MNAADRIKRGMLRRIPMPRACSHTQRTTVADFQGFRKNGHLCSERALPKNEVKRIVAASITFCSNPGCEHIIAITPGVTAT